MPRKAAVDQSIYLDEAEGFILEHALFSPPRTWPPLPSSPTNVKASLSLAGSKRKMDWEMEVRQNPDEPLLVTRRSKEGGTEGEGEEDGDKERCVICLMAIRDPTIAGLCGHEFCFECIGVWANQSRKCPLCSAEMSPFLLHDLDASTPTKFYLPPLPLGKIPCLPGPSRSLVHEQEWARQRERERIQSGQNDVEVDQLEMQIERRREIYKHELYVKHIGSNTISHYRPNPTPREISSNTLLLQRTTAFLRRELRVFTTTSTNVESLVNHIIHLLKAIDVRSEPAIRLLKEVLVVDDDTYPNGVEHFAHELYTFLRSPYKELTKFDEVAMYDDIPSTSKAQSRSRSPSPISSISNSRSRSRSRSLSPSPSLSSISSYASRSRGNTRKRRRDTFVPSPSPDGKRWDEHDTWLDPEYAEWLDEERRREQDRVTRRRKRKERERELRQPRNKIELLPSPSSLPIEDQSKSANANDSNENGNGVNAKSTSLSIRGAARVNGNDVTKLSLKERLEKAKAEAMLKNKPTLSTTALTLKERLAKAKAEAAQVRITDGNDGEGGDIGSIIEESNDTQTTSAIRPSTGVKEMVRARLRLRLKLEIERQRNASLTHAQALRHHLLAQKAIREKQQEMDNYGGMDSILRKMDVEDRKREVRRRLMVLKLLDAETEHEKRVREEKELKLKLLARRKPLTTTTTTTLTIA